MNNKLNQYPTRWRFLKAIEQLFLHEVNRCDELSKKHGQPGDREMYWKWISTRKVADFLDASLPQTRYHLEKLYKAGKISKRAFSSCNAWAPTEITGFKPSGFADFFERV